MTPQELVKRLISEYYTSHTNIEPRNISQREFGFGTLESKVAVRHMAFPTDKALHEYLVKNPPASVSCSQAFYKFPDARPMEKKEMLGAELVFDLDATEMDISCQNVHGKGWVCENCLTEVKKEVLKLIDNFLVPDFGFSEKDISVNFSGNRGYHIHIDTEDVSKLDGNARKAISDYISGNGLEFSEFFPTAGQRGTKLLGPKPDDMGWGGKIARGAIEALDSSPEKLAELGVDRLTAKKLHEKKSLIELGIRSGNWDMVYIKKKDEFWSKLVSRQAIIQSDKIDKNVTSDITHLLRLPNTIHGDTGLVAKKLKSRAEFEAFDPFKDAIAFKEGEMKVIANSINPLVMNGKSYGPYDNKEIVLPAYVGIYLYLKGYAKIKGYRK